MLAGTGEGAPHPTSRPPHRQQEPARGLNPPSEHQRMHHAHGSAHARNAAALARAPPSSQHQPMQPSASDAAMHRDQVCVLMALQSCLHWPASMFGAKQRIERQCQQPSSACLLGRRALGCVKGPMLPAEDGCLLSARHAPIFSSQAKVFVGVAYFEAESVHITPKILRAVCLLGLALCSTHRPATDCSTQ